jgi:hypothetical protein
MPFPSMVQTVLLGTTFVLSWGMCITKGNITPVAPYDLIHASYHQKIVLSFVLIEVRGGTFG